MGRFGVGAVPTFVVVGAQKCGTTALHGYLAAHPEIQMSTPKELDFFVAERNWRCGVEWYASHFDPASAARGETSPNYSAHPRWRGVPERLVAVAPDVRIVYLVRDPVERIASQWVHNWARRREDALVAANLHRRSSYVVRSCYMLQLDQFLRHLPRERVLVLDQRELLRDRTGTVARVFDFVGVDSAFRDPAFAVERHRSDVKHRPSDMALAVDALLDRTPLRRLTGPSAASRWERRFRPNRCERPDVLAALPPASLATLREDADRLRSFTGLPFAHWAV